MESRAATLAEQANAIALPQQALAASPAGMLRLVASLALLLAVAFLYDVEGRRQFFPTLCLIFAGAVVHTLLPRRARQPFFAALSMGTVLFVLGLSEGALVLGIGGGLIALCCVPLPLAARVLLIAAAGAGLAAWRNDDVAPFWVVVGSMFMFRLTVFLYDTRRERARPPLARTLSYFFLLPNVCFPLFPVVDYRKFCDTYYNDDEWAIYQRGTGWILRGIVHLLLYRFVKAYLVPELYEIRDVLTVGVFLATNYVLYLQVSGQFHLITGILHLFGFNLPRTHDRYFLASSVSDIWRRINIYWKDFLEKLVFLPAFFALRRRSVPATAAIVTAVFAVFFGTWLFHDWQAFWLLGALPMQQGDKSFNDAALWLAVGTLVAVNSLREYRKSRNPQPAADRPAWVDDLGLSLRTVGMFAVVSVFWACWTRSGFLSLTAVMLREKPGSERGLLLVPACLLATVVGGTVLLSLRRKWMAIHPERRSLTAQEAYQWQMIGLAALVAVGLPGFGRLLPERAEMALEDFRSDVYVQNDPFTELQSYYEDLNTAAVQAGPLLTSLTPQVMERRKMSDTFGALTRRADPLLEIELIPGWSGELDGHRMTINQFGMRDRKTVTLEKPEGTVRIACVGSSVVMGFGADDDEVFHYRFEDLLNERWGAPGRRIEVLNFGTGRQWALHRRMLVERKVLAFNPDVLLYFAHQDEFEGPLNQVTGLILHEIPFPDTGLDEIVQEAGLNSETPPGVIRVRLADPDRMRRILEVTYRALVDLCRSRGVTPVWAYFPIPDVEDAPDLSSELIPIATRAGFVVLDLNDWHADHDSADLKARPTDHHLNAAGNRLFAEQLFERIASVPEALPLLPPDESTGGR